MVTSIIQRPWSSHFVRGPLYLNERYYSMTELPFFGTSQRDCRYGRWSLPGTRTEYWYKYCRDIDCTSCTVHSVQKCPRNILLMYNSPPTMSSQKKGGLIIIILWWWTDGLMDWWTLDVIRDDAMRLSNEAACYGTRYLVAGLATMKWRSHIIILRSLVFSTYLFYSPLSLESCIDHIID
jgi:hypothetical protein